MHTSDTTHTTHVTYMTHMGCALTELMLATPDLAAIFSRS
jgi:hypothetical protein